MQIGSLKCLKELKPCCGPKRLILTYCRIQDTGLWCLALTEVNGIPLPGMG